MFLGQNQGNLKSTNQKLKYVRLKQLIAAVFTNVQNASARLRLKLERYSIRILQSPQQNAGRHNSSLEMQLDRCQMSVQSELCQRKKIPSFLYCCLRPFCASCQESFKVHNPPPLEESRNLKKNLSFLHLKKNAGIFFPIKILVHRRTCMKYIDFIFLHLPQSCASTQESEGLKMCCSRERHHIYLGKTFHEGLLGNIISGESWRSHTGHESQWLSPKEL